MDGKIIEFEEGDAPAEVSANLVSAKEILSQHRKQYAIPTSRGYIVVKKVTKLDADDAAVRMMRDPEYVKIVGNFKPLYEKMKRNEDRLKRNEPPAEEDMLSAEEMAALQELGEKMTPYMRPLMLCAIVKPEWIKTVKDLDALLSELAPAEADALYAKLTELSTPDTDKRVAGSILDIAKRFGINLPQDLNVENMTIDQATVFQNNLIDEANAVKTVQDDMMKAAKNATKPGAD